MSSKSLLYLINWYVSHSDKTLLYKLANSWHMQRNAVTLPLIPKRFSISRISFWVMASMHTDIIIVTDLRKNFLPNNHSLEN